MKTKRIRTNMNDINLDLSNDITIEIRSREDKYVEDIIKDYKKIKLPILEIPILEI